VSHVEARAHLNNIELGRELDEILDTVDRK